MEVIEIHFDGGTKPTNPGNGYGSFEISSKALSCKVARMAHGDKITSNEAEYLTLIAALQKVTEWAFLTAAKWSEIQLKIFSDSQLLINQLSGRWKVKCSRIKMLVIQVSRLTTGLKVDYQWESRNRNVERFGH